MFLLFVIPFIAASHINDAMLKASEDGSRLSRAFCEVASPSRTKMLCIFSVFFSINKISGILCANLALPFGGDAVVMIEVSEFEDGLQANRSVFPLYRIFCLLKYSLL